MENMAVFCKTAGYVGADDISGAYFGHDPSPSYIKVKYSCTGMEDSYMECESTTLESRCYSQGQLRCQTSKPNDCPPK